jgi:hypothetical protein
MKMRIESDQYFPSKTIFAMQFWLPKRRPYRAVEARIDMSRFKGFPLAIFLLAAPALAARPNELTPAERQGLIA